MDLKKVRQIIERYQYDRSSLVSILHNIQKEFHFLPRSAIKEISNCLDIPLSMVYEVATFYKAFSLEPKGRHTIKVCLGTACHVRGGARVLGYIESLLNIKEGESSADLRFNLETVNCLGACALGPVMVIDGDYFGKVEMDRIEPILQRYR